MKAQRNCCNCRVIKALTLDSMSTAAQLLPQKLTFNQPGGLFGQVEVSKQALKVRIQAPA